MTDPNLPEGIRSKLLKAFVNHLKESALLSAFIKTWHEFEGDGPQDHEAVPLSLCPAIRFTYSSPGQYPESFASTKADITISMEVIIPGSNQYQMLDLWEVLEDAIDQFKSLDSKLREAVAGTPVAAFGAGTISAPTINHAKYKNPPAMVGTGSVTITLSIRR